MAKITAYKFINPGVVGTSSTPVVRAVSKQILAVNRLGSTVEGIGHIVKDIVDNNKATIVFQKSLEQQRKRDERLALDAAAEARQETANAKLKTEREKDSKDAEDKLDKTKVEKEKGGFLGFVEKLIGPFVSILKDIASIVVTKAIFEYLADPANRDKLQDFIEKFTFVFTKIYKFVDNLVRNTLDGFTKLFGKDSDFFTRLEGLGKAFAGIIALKYLMNPFSLIEDIFSLIDGIGSFFDKKAKAELDNKPKVEEPDAKPKKGYYDDAVETSERNARRLAEQKPNALQRFLSGAGDWAKNQYDNLSAAVRKQWENIVNLGKKLSSKSLAAASAVGNKLGDARKFIADGVSSLGSKAKQYVLEKIVEPLKKAFAPLVEKLKKIGTKVEDALFSTPLGKKAAEALKKKGLYPVMDNLGPLSKKLGGKALPIIGGALNLAFGYDRLASGDPFGALLEFLSGGFDISGLFGFVPGPGISMGIDAYMFARDLIPGIQEMEGKILDSIPGVKGIGDAIKGATKNLPNLGQIVSGLGGDKKKLEEKASGGPVGLVNPTPKVNPSTQPGGYAADTGLDIIGKTGDPIVAPLSGTLEYAERGHVAQMGQDSDPTKPGIQDQHSFRIKIDKPFTYAGKKVNFVYGTHLSTLHPGVKDKSGIHINAGTVMGKMGVANNVPHLHLGFVGDRSQNTFLNFQEMKKILGGAPDPGGDYSDTSSDSESVSASSASSTPAIPQDPAAALEMLKGQMAELFGPAPEKETIGNIEFSKTYAFQQNAPETLPIPVVFTMAEPIYTPMPINTSQQVINAKPSPLVDKK